MHGPGTQLAGRYRLAERIGAGGMGEVWRGTDEVLGRTVAVKIMLAALLDQSGFDERFRAEARTMANLNHPGVVDVYDYHSDSTVAFLVMEYVAGEALSRTLGRVGRLTGVRTMVLLAQAADALQAAHDQGIVHRDVKPGNLLVRPDGTLVLTDFGIARSAQAGQLTATGTVLGTASYLSPEQAAGKVATSASDVYALGVVGYECLAGHRPFEGGNPVEIAMRHMNEAPPSLPSDTSPAVRDVVLRAMAKEPAARWPSAAHLASAARQAAAQAGSGARPGGESRTAASAPTRVVQHPGAAGPTAVVGRPGGYRPGSAPVVSNPVQYATPSDTAAVRMPGPLPARDRPSWVFIAAVVLGVVAVLLCAGLAGHLARQWVDGSLDLNQLFTITYAQHIEGSTTI
jgi:eukaryotic-like serine/threonine-protein kinase